MRQLDADVVVVVVDNTDSVATGCTVVGSSARPACTTNAVVAHSPAAQRTPEAPDGHQRRPVVTADS